MFTFYKLCTGNFQLIIKTGVYLKGAWYEEIKVAVKHARAPQSMKPYNK